MPASGRHAGNSVSPVSEGGPSSVFLALFKCVQIKSFVIGLVAFPAAEDDVDPFAGLMSAPNDVYTATMNIVKCFTLMALAAVALGVSACCSGQKEAPPPPPAPSYSK